MSKRMHWRDMWGLYRISDQCNVMGCAAVEERGYAGVAEAHRTNRGQMSR